MIDRVESLATRALGDVFEQLERVGAVGRARCRPVPFSAGEVTPVGRHEVVEILQLAQDALDYARVHVDYLPRQQTGPFPRRVGTRVVVSEDEGPWRGTIVAFLDDDRVRVRADNGDELEVLAQTVEAAE